MKKRNVLVGILVTVAFIFLTVSVVNAALIISGDCHKEVVDYNSSTYLGYWSTIKVDSDGNSHIAYYDYAAEDIKYAKWNGTGWEIEVVPSDDKVYTEDFSISMDLDSNDYPHIAYCHEDDPGGIERLRYVKWDGASWSDESADSTDYTGGFPSLVLDSNNKAHIIYYNYADNRVDYATNSAGSWSLDTIAFATSITYRISIDMDSHNIPHVFFAADGVGVTKDYIYGKKNGDTWDTEIVDYSPYNGGTATIILDSNDYPRVVYQWRLNSSTSFTLRYGEWNGNDWEITHFEERVYPNYLIQPSLVLDILDNPHIMIFPVVPPHGSEQENLSYIYYDGYDWLWNEIDTTSNVSAIGGGIDFDGINNRIVFSYAGNGTQPYPVDTGLMYAYCNITEWNFPHGIYGNVYLLPDYVPDNHTDIICSNTTYSASATSNNTGYYQFDNLYFGNYWINASRFDYKDNNAVVEVAAGWNQTLLSNGDSL